MQQSYWFIKSLMRCPFSFFHAFLLILEKDTPTVTVPTWKSEGDFPKLTIVLVSVCATLIIITLLVAAICRGRKRQILRRRCGFNVIQESRGLKGISFGGSFSIWYCIYILHILCDIILYMCNYIWYCNHQLHSFSALSGSISFDVCFGIYGSSQWLRWRLISISICLSIYLPIFLSVNLSFCLSICLFACLAVCLSACLYAFLSVCLRACQSVFSTWFFLFLKKVHSHGIVTHRMRI